MIEAAKALARRAHAGQKRKWSEDDYFEHPRRVAERVSLLYGSYEVMVAAAYLHDVLEETTVTEKEILDATNLEVLELVIELTNRKYQGGLSRQTRKLLDAARLSRTSPLAKIIKIIDRIDNLDDMMIRAPRDFKDLYHIESLHLAYTALRDADDELLDELIKKARTP
jgi:(p)ppGpp synthase/HD superfamily hydrolase